MKPTIAIGDIHGLASWKYIVEAHPSSRIIFLGDYLDPYFYIPNNVIINNLENIINLKKERGDDVILLLGNHDAHYFEEDAPISTRLNSQIAPKVSKIFLDNRMLFTYAFQDGHTIFTHAGISQQWFDFDFGGDPNGNIADQLNNPANPMQRNAIFNVGYKRGGMVNANGGILWADIDELTNPLQGYTQVVGHNRVDKVTERQGATPDTKIVFCDCLFNDCYLQIDE